MKNNKNKNQQGLSLFIVTIMVAVLLGLSLSVANIIIGSVAITSNLADSVKAFHCADTGIEVALYNAKNSVCTSPSSGTVNGESAFGYTYTITGDCTSTGTTIISSGTYGINGASTRRIKISY
jgi:Tfp pilus assembly protein PilX